MSHRRPSRRISRRFSRRDFSKPSTTEIFPARIYRLHQRDLSPPRPSFQLFLSLDRGADVFSVFKIGQPVDSVLAREAVVRFLLLMFEDSSLQVVRDADVQ